MERAEVYNTLFVEVFNRILKWEQNLLTQGEFADLSITEIHTLDAIERSPEQKMKEIAHKLSITLSTLTTAVNNLIKKNYVESRRHKQDKRIVNVYMTEKGKAALQKHKAFHEAMVDAVLSGLNAQEQQALQKALENVCDYFYSVDHAGKKALH